jgi:hypothetical protein
MKILFKFSLVVFVVFWCSLVVAQQSSLLTNRDIKVKTNFLNPDAECTGTGQLIYDDGTFENGYGWNATLVTVGVAVSKFTPPEYPWQFNTVCFAFTQNQSTTLNFDAIIYDDDGPSGGPGTIVATVTGLTATGIPAWPTLAWFDYNISSVQQLTSGSWYIGIRWNSVPTYPGTFIGADETVGNPHNPGYGWNDYDNAWVEYQTWYPNFAALGIRTLGEVGSPCPITEPTNPNPANGATNVNINLGNISWTNSAGTTHNTVWFGPQGNVVQVYDGPATTTYAVGTLNYMTSYQWQVRSENDTCGRTSSWSFTTMQNPNLVIDTVDVYPQNANYWTGSTTAAAKTQVSLMNAMAGGEQAWAKFDVTPIAPGATITSVSVNWYISAQNCPYFYVSALPIDPVTANAATLYSAITGGVHYYTFQTCPVTGWNTVMLGGNANADLAASLTNGWFAVSFYEYESDTYYFNAQGWAEANKPYLHVIYEYIVPVELTSFTATGNEGSVELSWITATETNNQGFEVQRSNGSDFETIAFVEGHGTTTESQAYSYSDRSVNDGSYSYRLKQIDFNGTFEYSNVIEVDVSALREFALDQNYPNPFNPSTKISFRLAVDSKVSLKVFNILGQEVATLINTNLVAGAHDVNFDASKLNSGVYLYRIEATGIDGSNFMDVKKMILTK